MVCRFSFAAGPFCKLCSSVIHESPLWPPERRSFVSDVNNSEKQYVFCIFNLGCEARSRLRIGNPWRGRCKSRFGCAWHPHQDRQLVRHVLFLAPKACGVSQLAPRPQHIEHGRMGRLSSNLYIKMAAGMGSFDDEFGILEDDRCIDTGCFQARYLLAAATKKPHRSDSGRLVCLQDNSSRDLVSSEVCQLVLNEPFVSRQQILVAGRRTLSIAWIQTTASRRSTTKRSIFPAVPAAFFLAGQYVHSLPVPAPAMPQRKSPVQRGFGCRSEGLRSASVRSCRFRRSPPTQGTASAITHLRGALHGAPALPAREPLNKMCSKPSESQQDSFRSCRKNDEFDADAVPCQPRFLLRSLSPLTVRTSLAIHPRTFSVRSVALSQRDRRHRVRPGKKSSSVRRHLVRWTLSASRWNAADNYPLQKHLLQLAQHPDRLRLKRFGSSTKEMDSFKSGCLGVVQASRRKD